MTDEEWFFEAHHSDAAIEFFTEDIDFSLPQEETTSDWITKIIAREEKKLLHLSFIFCSDQYLHQINISYLDHDTLTDIITFPYAEPPVVEGDIFISIDRIRENAGTYDVPFETELRRVIIHGVLHLCGYGDKSEDEKSMMRKKEDEALRRWEER